MKSTRVLFDFMICLVSTAAAAQGEWVTISNPAFLENNNPIWCIESDASNTLWIGTNTTGILKYSDGIWSDVNSSNSQLPDNTIYDLKYDGSSMWAASSASIVKIDGATMQVFKNGQSPLPIYTPSCLYVDDKGNVWFAQNYCGGGNIIEIEHGTSAWKVFDENNSPFPANIWIRDLVVDHNDVLWVATYGNGLYRLDAFGWMNYTSANSSLPSDLVKAVATTDDGLLYVGTDAGTSTFNGSEWNEINNIQTNTFDCNGNDVWIGFDNFSNAAYNVSSGESFSTANSGLSTNFIYGIEKDGAGNIWFAGFPTSLVELKNTVSGISSSTINQAITVFPNPFNDKVIITGTSDPFYLINILGEVVQVPVTRIGANFEINTLELNLGVYFLVSPLNNQLIKIIKQ